jgi:hypothetical protein
VNDLPDNYDDLSSLEKIEFHFPLLAGGVGYTDTSDATNEYNCLAWALGINWTRYDPEPQCAGYYWFPGVERKWNERNIRQIFQNHGYEEADNYDLEDGYEKIVFYISADGEPQHFSRQLPNGRWTSKLGDLNDIEHDTLECIAVEDYGRPQVVLQRKIQR